MSLGLAAALLLAPLALARSPLTHDDPETFSCRGVAPSETSCDLGTHTAWRWYASTLGVARNYTGTLDLVIAHPLGDYRMTCAFQNGWHVGGCATEGPGPLRGVPFRVGCFSLALWSEDAGGAGAWGCSFTVA